MLEAVGDIWEYEGRAVIVITTNGSVTKDGSALFGKGVARQASLRCHQLAGKLGKLLGEQGNHVHDLGNGLVSFPVEDTPWSQPDLRLIARSARELQAMADRKGWSLIVIPRPGCGGGGLQWRDVKPLLADCLDDRFIAICNK